MIIVCLDTAVNLPFLLVALVQDIASGKSNSANASYKSWENVHHGLGGNIPPELGLGTILQVPAANWSMDKWSVLSVKWDEWIFVFYAVVFFAVFGTTSEMKNLLLKYVRAVTRRPKAHSASEQGPGQANPTFATAPEFRTRVRAAPHGDSLPAWSDESVDLTRSSPTVGQSAMGHDAFELRPMTPVNPPGVHSLGLVSETDDDGANTNSMKDGQSGQGGSPMSDIDLELQMGQNANT